LFNIDSWVIQARVKKSTGGLFANFCHMVDLSFVSTMVFELSKSEFV